MGLMDELNDKKNLNNQNQSSESSRTKESEIGKILHEQQGQLNKIESAVNKKNENEKKKNDVLQQRIEEREKSENERNNRNDKVIKTLEVSTSNFNHLINNLNQGSQETKKRFIRTGQHYISRIDTDNLKQDFSKAIEEELSDVKKEV